MDKKHINQEWEGFTFPLIVSSIKSQLNNYKIPLDAVLKIWRDEDYRLKGILTGVIDNQNDLEYHENGKIKGLGFITGDTISASNNEYNCVLNSFIIDSISFNQVQTSAGIKIAFEASVFFDNIQRVCDGENTPEILVEWFLCSMPNVLFGNRTSRYPGNEKYKIREGLDTPLKDDISLKSKTYSSSWDYAIIEYEDLKIVIQEINKEILPNWTNGIAIEYRNLSSKKPTTKTRKMISEYLSFLFGSHLQLIGLTEFSTNYEVLNFESQNPWKRNVRKKIGYQPKPLKITNDRFFFERILNTFLPIFANEYKSISISDCLWKLWIGSEQPIGCNLPIISAGLETLISSYLEREKIIKKYDKNEKKAYENFIAQEVNSLEVKLKSYQFGQFVLNKIKNPYNFGIGEKMSVFFDSLDFKFEKNSIEAQALKARNTMTHQGFDVDDIEKILEIKKTSDAYVTLVNRVILKLMCYEGYYIDYSKEGIRYIKMGTNM